MNLEVGIFVVGKDGKGGVASTCANLEEHSGRGVLAGYVCEYGKFLLQPFPVFEEIGCVVLIKEVPPLGWVGVKSAWIELA